MLTTKLYVLHKLQVNNNMGRKIRITHFTGKFVFEVKTNNKDDNDNNNNVLVLFVILLYLSKFNVRSKSRVVIKCYNDSKRGIFFLFKKKESLTEDFFPCLLHLQKLSRIEIFKFNLILEVHFLPCDLTTSMTLTSNVKEHMFRK